MHRQFKPSVKLSLQRLELYLKLLHLKTLLILFFRSLKTSKLI